MHVRQEASRGGSGRGPIPRQQLVEKFVWRDGSVEEAPLLPAVRANDAVEVLAGEKGCVVPTRSFIIADEDANETSGELEETDGIEGREEVEGTELLEEFPLGSGTARMADILPLLIVGLSTRLLTRDPISSSPKPSPPSPSHWDRPEASDRTECRARRASLPMRAPQPCGTRRCFPL